MCPSCRSGHLQVLSVIRRRSFLSLSPVWRGLGDIIRAEGAIIRQSFSFGGERMLPGQCSELAVG